MALVATLLLVAVGCATFQEIARLRQVDFAIDRASNARLAGVALDRIEGYEDLRADDLGQVLAAVQRRRVPLAFTLHLDAENPRDNPVAARLLRLDWKLYLRDRETVQGRLRREFVLPPGETVDVPISIELDLLRFFGENARDLVDIAAAATGRGGRAPAVRLTARPTIDTPLGPITYPGEITIVAR
jgi:hypothetical protein